MLRQLLYQNLQMFRLCPQQQWSWLRWVRHLYRTVQVLRLLRII